MRLPLRNSGLAAATTNLRAVYRSAFQRTGEYATQRSSPALSYPAGGDGGKCVMVWL